MAQYSYKTGSAKTFHAGDYAVLAGMLSLSAGIGLFYAIKDRKKKTTDNYLLADRAMHPVPVAMSLTSTFISAIAILGVPAEVYVHSTMYWWLSVGMIVSSFGAAHVFMPIFYNLRVTSVFQYIEMRFGKIVRTISTILYLLNMMLYMAIVLYVPSLALNAVTGLSLWGSIILVSLVCIFYTALGGMKAVLWTDTLQMSIVYIGMLALLIRGSVILGGFSKAWDTADKGGRIVLLEYNFDPRVRHTIWTIVFGGGIIFGGNFGTNQASVQRALSVSSLKQSKIAIWLIVPGITAIITLGCLVGVVMYAFYANCDPFKFGLIKRPEQIIPLYMMDLLEDFPGVPGLLLSCIFSGSLSTISSGLNGISAVMLEDFAKPFCCNNISPSRATALSKAFVVVSGLLALLFAFIVSEIGGLVLQLTYVLFGILSGPLIGIFVLGMLFPWSNKFGCLAGYFTSLVVMLWIGIATVITKTSIARWPAVSTDGCSTNSSSLNMTDMTTILPSTTLEPAVTSSMFDKYSGIQKLYTLSYMWYAALATIITAVVGLVVSLLTGPTDPTTINPRLICPIFDVCFPWLPEKLRQPLRFGVRHGEDDDDNESLTGVAMSDRARPEPVGKHSGTENNDSADIGTYEMDYVNPDFQDPTEVS